MSNEKRGIPLSKKSRVIIVLLILLLIAGGVCAGMYLKTDGKGVKKPAKLPELDDHAVAWQGEQPMDKPQTEDGQAGIAIPGYKAIRLEADTTKQAVNLYNPEGNDCYFVMSLILPDGTTVWKSKMVAPGQGLYEIELEQTIAAGTYENSILKYECYKRDEELTPLNGGEVKLILEVE